MAHNEQPTSESITLRTEHRPGDMGLITSRHGAIYAREYGWSTRFEALVGRICASFIDDFDPAFDRCWIAERRSSSNIHNTHSSIDESSESTARNFLGSIMLVKDRSCAGTAKLRLLLVEREARGCGLGKRLIRECLAFARQVGYERVVLWTQSVLVAARRLYKEEGFELVSTEEHESIGIRLVGEMWELRLRKKEEEGEETFEREELCG